MNRGEKPKTEEKEWRKKFRNLTKSEKGELLQILCNNRKKQSLINAYAKTKDQNLKSILSYYLPDNIDKNINLPLFKDI